MRPRRHAEVDAPRLIPLSTRFSCRATQQRLAECGVEPRLPASRRALDKLRAASPSCRSTTRDRAVSIM